MNQHKPIVFSGFGFIMARFGFYCILPILLLGCPDDDSSEPFADTPIFSTGSNLECESNEDCLKGEYCDDVLSICRVGCEGDSDCNEGTVCDTSANLCVSCLVNADCAFGVCHPQFKSCVPCLADSDCGDGACLPDVYSCVGCIDDSYCGEGFCDKGEFLCLQCTKDSHCDDGDPCTQNRCQDDVCVENDLANTIGCFGVECIASSDCPSEEDGCASCEEGVCGTLQGQAICDLDEDCLPESGNLCFVGECKKQACGGSACLFTLLPDCESCLTDADCGAVQNACASTCQEGICAHVLLGTPGCECLTGEECQSPNSCESGVCEESVCSYTTLSDGATCDDGDPCSKGETCAAGYCTNGKFIADCGEECAEDSDCGINGLGCTASCNDGFCQYPPLGGMCPSCISDADCQDDAPCTKNSCNQGICIQSFSGAGVSCDDGDLCTIQDGCFNGNCVGAALPNCPGECLLAEDCEMPADGVCSISCIDFSCEYVSLNALCPEQCPTPSPCFTNECQDNACGPLCIQEPKAGCTPCESDAQCDSKNPCFKTYCDTLAGECVGIELSGITCDDDDLCTPLGVCSSGNCLLPSLPSQKESNCDDGNPCTVDQCDSLSGCTNVATPGIPCNDEDPCTLSEICTKDGICSQPDSGITDPFCEVEPSLCQPSSLCNTKNDCPADSEECTCIPSCPSCTDCVEKVCAPESPKSSFEEGTEDEPSLLSPYYLCSESTKACVDSPNCTCIPSCPECKDCAALVCWDTEQCTDCVSESDCGKCATCEANACVKDPLCETCDSSEDCNADACEICEDGVCKTGPDCGGCLTDDQCNADACESCVDGECKTSPDCGGCLTDDQCNADACESCVDGVCKTGPDCKKCLSDDECNGSPCEICVVGECQVDPTCEQCLTDDQCDASACEFCAAGTCLADPDCGGCLTDDDCSAVSCEICVEGFCMAESPGPGCEVILCGGPGSACTLVNCVDTLCGGECVSTAIPGCDACETSADCESKGPCYESDCNKVGVCTSTPLENGVSCADGTACGGMGQCLAGGCQVDAELSCDDGNPCTLDKCNEDFVCIHDADPLESTTCSDGDLCTTDDLCAEGACLGGATLDCDDGNPCTENGCVKGEGCAFPKATEGTTCDDGNACSASSSCQNGECLALFIKICNTFDALCTSTACDPKTGACVEEAETGTACSPTGTCTDPGICEKGVCMLESGTWAGMSPCDPDNPILACADGDSCSATECGYFCLSEAMPTLCCNGENGPYVSEEICPMLIGPGPTILEMSECAESSICCEFKDGGAFPSSSVECFNAGGIVGVGELCDSPG